MSRLKEPLTIPPSVVGEGHPVHQTNGNSSCNIPVFLLYVDFLKKLDHGHLIMSVLQVTHENTPYQG